MVNNSRDVLLQNFPLQIVNFKVFSIRLNLRELYSTVRAMENINQKCILCSERIIITSETYYVQENLERISRIAATLPSRLVLTMYLIVPVTQLLRWLNP